MKTILLFLTFIISTINIINAQEIPVFLYKNPKDTIIYSKAVKEYSNGNFQLGLSILSKQKKIYYTDCAVLRLRAFLHSSLGNHAEALKNIDLAIYFHPEQKILAFDKANIHYDLENYLEAAENYSKFLISFPEHQDATINLAYSLTKINRPDEAIKKLEDLSTKNTFVFTALGNLYSLLKEDEKKSIEYYKLALVKDSTNYDAQLGLAISYYFNDDFKLGLETIEQYLKYVPKNGKAYFIKGSIARELNLKDLI
jgi:tetratricopeptide (TPR) repeat protein